MMIFGVFPSLIFLLFANNNGKYFWNFISKKTIINFFIFGILVFVLGAVSLWPQLQLMFAGGSTNSWEGAMNFDPAT